MKRSGFTLIELLVVVGIITLLLGMLMPTVVRARESARKIRCQANLHSIGQGIQGYLNQYHGYYPPMAILPTDEPTSHPSNPRPAMCEVLAGEMDKQMEVFHCPSDRVIDPTMVAQAALVGQTTYYGWQGSSYGPVEFLSIVEASGHWKLSREGRYQYVIMGMDDNASKMPLVHEYAAFHALSASDDGVLLTLFADFHVADMAE